MQGNALFVHRPRRIEELWVPHILADERSYIITKTVELAGIDYENFVTDMLADREFLEANATYCGKGTPWQCLLIRKRDGKDGILVVPNGSFVEWAAYYSAKDYV